ncbi:MAG TPA: M3 family metallopeptidase [Patescibacteria group bacterium]|nr:M3 family metallopeptidase [Patescibacteria group bacterium]
MANNSLLHPVNELHYGTYKPADAKQALTATEKAGRKNIAAVLALADADRTFDNTLLALTRSTDDFDSIVGRISHLESVLGEDWREADLLATAMATKLANDVSLNKDVYDALVVLKKSKHYAAASAAQKKLLDDTIQDFERGGIALPEAKKKQLKDLRHKLSKATTQFGQNVVKAHDKAGIHVTDAAALAGLSKPFLTECRAAAKKKELTGYWVRQTEPNYVKVMTDCTVRDTRLAMYKSAKSEGLAPNEKLAKEILKMRYELAALVGYKTFADYATADRMAKTGKAARDFITGLSERYQPGVAGETAELEQFAREYEKDPGFKLHISDVESGLDLFYAQRLRNQKFDLDEQQVREYFPVATVLQGMFDVLRTLYGVTFKRLPEMPAWHPDVEVYAIYDEQGCHLATVWCDWFAREGKHGGAWMNQLHVADRAQGKALEPHLGHVCANLQPPHGDQPSLLTMDEVRVIWHEFGHFMHLALGRTELVEQSMMSSEWDFVEAPSQIMENWPWQDEVLQIIGKHYKTGKPMPASLIKNLRASRDFRVAGKAVRQLMFAEWDLALHMDYADAPPADPLRIAADIKERIYGMKPASYDKTLLTFTHVFSGGYAAGYYSYKWAEAIEADLFTEFEKGGVLNPAVGRKYRDKVLARGAEVKAAEIVKGFLGRPSTTAAMLRRDGMKP